MSNVLICLLSSLLWRVRGGLKIKGHKIPLNKIWFALFYAGAFCYLTSFSWNVWAVVSIATLVAYQEYGWGEYVGCLLCGSKPSERSDCDLVDDIVDSIKVTINSRDIKIWKWTIHIPKIEWKLTDFPVLFGWLGLSLRGGIMSFTIGLAMQNIPYMFTGLAMGTVYWLGGLVCKYIIDDGKCGWRWAEWLYGLYMGIVLCVIF